MNHVTPYVSRELLVYLEAVYPDGLSETPVSNLDEINFKIGQQDIIRHLGELFAQQEQRDYLDV